MTKGKLDLVGTAEAADILRVERPRIGRWLKEGKMPEPVAVLAATPIWMRADVEAMVPWVEARRRTRGVEQHVEPENPCGCGCGGDAGVYTRSDRRRGQERGAPRRYIPGHEKHALNQVAVAA